MPSKTSQATVLSAEQVQLLCQVVQHSEPLTKASWDIVAEKLNITNGNAAQQRFGRLLKNLKSAEPNGISDEKTPRPKTIGKRAAPGKQNGTAVKSKAYAMHADGEDDDDQEAERKLADDEETPSKKCKTGKQNSTPKWNSVFERNDDVITIEDDEKNDEKNEDDAATIKAEGELDWEDVI